MVDRTYVSLSDAIQFARPGYLLQIRGTGYFFTPWVRIATGGIHTHSAMVTGFNEISEVREFVGGRVTTLEYQYEKYKGQMDFFRVRDQFYDPVGVGRAILAMRYMAFRCDYDWWNIVRIGLIRLPLGRLLLASYEDEEPVITDTRRHCSDAVAVAYNFGLGADPVPFTPHRLVTPNDLTRSLMFEYKFSL